MYADRYARPEGIKPGSLAVAIGINAAVVGALIFSAPIVTGVIRDKPLIAENVPLDPPPEPIPPETKAQPQQHTRATPERVETSTATGATADTGYVIPTLPPLPPLGDGGGVTIDPPRPLPAPVLVGSSLDPRYARDLQPPYPPGERRAEREGVVRLRVTIGTDGRVAAAECVEAASDDFCRVTRAQALAKWRFRPATRDGTAIEETKVMTVRFRLDGGGA